MADERKLLAEVRNLSVNFRMRYANVQAVRNVSWRIHEGEVLAILGESGSGKSVSAAAFMGLIDSPPGQIAGGEILYRGIDLLKVSPKERCQINGRRIGMIFQDPLAALNPVYSVGWQIAEAFRLHGVSAADARERTLRLLERVGIPDPPRRARDYPHQFSGGQRQRIVIAMAIAMAPDLLIADEPTASLDVTVQAQILSLLRGLQKETGMGLILITHDIGIVAENADHVVVMNDGEVVESGDTATVLRSPQHPYTQRLLSAIPGRQHAIRNDTTARSSGEELLQVRDLVKVYPTKISFFGRELSQLRAVDGVSLDVRKGETVGIVGESGSGKSTMARILLGLSDPTSGTITYRGRTIAGLTGTETSNLRRRIQFVFQDPTASLNPRMTVEEIISEPWTIHPDALPKAEWSREVGVLLEQVGLKPAHASRYPHQFSGGQRQRIAIARALALRPELIICDEAVSALDVSVQAQVIALLMRLRKEFGLSYIFIAHDLAVVRDFANRVLVMYRGKIVEQGTTEEVFGNPQHPYTRELLAASPSADLDRVRARAGI